MVDQTDDAESEQQRKVEDWDQQGEKLLKWPLERFVGAIDTKGKRIEAFKAIIQFKSQKALIAAMKSLQNDLRKSSTVSTFLTWVGIVLTCALVGAALFQAYVMWWVAHRP